MPGTALPKARTLLRVVLVALALLGGVRPAIAQVTAAPPADELRIFLLTMGPGDEVWEKFGHNALWVHDPAAGTDIAYNYGMFDFQQEDFLLRFIQGRMLYWMEGFDAPATVQHYQGYNRSVSSQELNLTPAQEIELRDFLQWNASPENRFYRYDYYRDNCSTRIRDAIDRVLGGTLRAQTANVPSNTTYRWHTERLTTDDVPTYTGLMMGLAQPADQPISRWEEMFLPGKLHDELQRVRVLDAAGRSVPLVVEERMLVESVGRAPERQQPPNRIAIYLLAGVALAGCLALLGYAAGRRGVGRFFFAAFATAWTMFIGFGGFVLSGLWAFTDHTIAYRNENILQIDPLAVPLILLVPCVAYGVRWAARPAVVLSVLVAAIGVLGFVLQLLPAMYQANEVVIALILPVNLALAWAMTRLTAAQRSTAEVPGSRSTTARRSRRPTVGA